MAFFSILITLICLPALFLAGRYNLHMFQLNGYFNNEHRAWLAENHGRQRSLAVLLVLGLAGLAYQAFTGPTLAVVTTGSVTAVFRITSSQAPAVILGVLQAVVAIVATVYFNYMKKWNTKKNLVYTNRVKRMVADDVIITLLVLILCVCLFSIQALPAAVAIMTAAQFVIFMVSNTLNKPLEKALKGRYIRDAKKKLAEVPDLKVIGVTGSYGKTSVKFYLQTLLQGHFNVLVTPESYNTPMGIVMTVRQYLRSTHQIFVCEMGARREGEIKEVCDIAEPDMGLITSIGPQHLDTFHDMETIVRTKFELADALPAGGTLFLNGDNAYCVDEGRKRENVVFYQTAAHGEGKDLGGGYTASDLAVTSKGTEFTVHGPDGESEVFQTRLVGEHNVINIAGAIAVAATLGIPMKELRVPVRRIKPVNHRMEMKDDGNVTIIDDAYNSNPVGSKAAVETLKLFDGVKILITPGMVELGEQEEEYNYKFGQYAADCCDYILLMGKNRATPIRQGALDAGFPEDRIHVYSKLTDAMSFARGVKDPGHKYILLENDLPDNY